MSILLAALVRSAAFGLGLAGFYAAAPTLFPDDDGLGTGLIAFALLITVSFVWAILDGRSRGVSASVVVWLVVAVAVSIGWWVALAVSGADASMSTVELLKADASSMIFTGGLILVPAAVGAAIGSAMRPTPRQSDS